MNTKMTAVEKVIWSMLKIPVLIGISGLFIILFNQVPFSETVFATSSVKYMLDLQEKNGCLESMQEGVVTIEDGLDKGKVSSVAAPATIDEKMKRLDFSSKNIMEIVPPSTKIFIEPHLMSGTLSPETSLKVAKEDKKQGTE